MVSGGRCVMTCLTTERQRSPVECLDLSKFNNSGNDDAQVHD